MLRARGGQGAPCQAITSRHASAHTSACRPSMQPGSRRLARQLNMCITSQRRLCVLTHVHPACGRPYAMRPTRVCLAHGLGSGWLHVWRACVWRACWTASWAIWVERPGLIDWVGLLVQHILVVRQFGDHRDIPSGCLTVVPDSHFHLMPVAGCRRAGQPGRRCLTMTRSGSRADLGCGLTQLAQQPQSATPQSTEEVLASWTPAVEQGRAAWYVGVMPRGAHGSKWEPLAAGLLHHGGLSVHTHSRAPFAQNQPLECTRPPLTGSHVHAS